MNNIISHNVSIITVNLIKEETFALLTIDQTYVNIRLKPNSEVTMMIKKISTEIFNLNAPKVKCVLLPIIKLNNSIILIDSEPNSVKIAIPLIENLAPMENIVAMHILRIKSELN
jgi:hypothetical protein